MGRKRKLFISFLFVILFGLFSYTVVATVIATFSVRGNIEVSTTSIEAEASYTSSTSNFNLTYNSPGDSKYITVNVSNNTESDSLHVYHELSYQSGGSEDLAPAILVYLNNEYVGTLNSIISNNTVLSDEYSLVSCGESISDKITFELHNSADDGLFDGKNVNIKINTFTENMDYGKYILVKNASEFTKAIDDINSGYFEVAPTIVLENAITANAVTITNPAKIYTNYALTCPITLNDDDSVSPDALLEISGKGTVSSVTLGANYDKEGAKALVRDYAVSKLGNGLIPNTEVNIIGPYSFYGLSIVTDSSTSFTSPNLTSTINYSSTSDILIGTTSSDAAKLELEVKVLGRAGIISGTVLNHLPSTDEIVSCDLFLPTSIPSQNATITWKSSDTSIMSDDGRIVAVGKVDSVDGAITLTAIIKVNGNVYTTKYDFKVSSHSNEVNFQKLVQEMSPLIITLVDDGTEDTKYYLPNVGTYNTTTGKFSQYDYRTTFTTPVTNPTVTWNEYQNINLASLVYSMTAEQSAAYDYITIDSTTNNKVYLSKNTLSNYAKITVTGTFENGEEYSSIVNISIAVGTDTQLLEKAFSSVDSALDEISILGNILKTRSTEGIIGEKGDFILPSKYGTNYILTYRCDSNIITGTPIAVDENGDPTLDESEIVGYKFVVNPINFNSSETSIPIYVTVTYEREELDDIVKQKVVYIDAPAAIHMADVGSISIFNSLKYQTFQAIGETTNNGFSTSDSILTDSGYDYLLIRDIIGDQSYLTDYMVDDLYLTMNNITSSNYQSGVSSLALTVASTNNSSTTDTDAYDFIKLIQWAMGNAKVSASSVVSSAGQTTLGATLGAYKSNGEVYLSPNELKVIETFYKAKTNDDGTVWDALKAISMETAPGRIYDNADLLEAVLRSLTNEKGTNTSWYENAGNGTYGKIYAKYLEIVNRYAITTSENEEPMSPAQEVYNSKFYYSFTTTAQNSTNGNNTTQVSFPCKYYNAEGELVSGYCNRYEETNWRGYGSGNRQGTYAASAKKGNAAVDLYANATGYPYDSDKTKYITSAELMVIKAFWLGSLGIKNQAASNNVLHEFSDDSKTLISAALAAKDGILPYPDYTIDDFTYYGQAILNAYDACLVIPTYLSSNGVNLLISSFYDNYNTDGYDYRSYTDSTDTTTFKSVLVNGVPAVTNLDNLEGGLSFFSNLTSLEIKGNTSLAAFLGDYGLSQAFARITLTNTKLTSLTMQYVSSDWNTFDLTNIKNLTSIATIDVSNNLGIKSVTPFLNSNRSSYTSVNFSNIGEIYEYNAFVIDNLAYTCNVTYSSQDNSVLTKNKISGNASALINLSDINDLVSEHLYLTNVIYNDDGTTTDVCWRIEQGNEIDENEINQGGELEEIDDIREMNLRVSPYFYCSSNFTYFGYNFIAKGLYKIVKNSSGVVTVTPINLDGNNNLLYSIELVNGVPSTDYENISDSDQNLTIHDPHLKFSGEYSRTQTATDTTDTIYSQDSSIVSNTVYYNLRFRYNVFSFRATENPNRQNYGPYTFYLRATANEFTYSRNAISTDCYFVLLNQNEADFVVELRNNNFHNTTDLILEKYGISPVGNNITLGESLPNSGSIYDYYIYNVYNQKFLTIYGFSDEPVSMFDINVSSKTVNGSYSNYTVYYMRNQDNAKYLSQTKIYTNENSTDLNYAIGVVYYKSVKNDNLAEAGTGNYSRFRIYWECSESNTYVYTNSLVCAENTPTLDITSGKDMTATAYFNCVYIGNGTNASSSSYKIYDTGIFLLNSNSPSTYGENAKFCFLTEEEKDKLEEWYQNPQEDITVGSIPSNYQYYYIYCPYTRRFISGGSSDKNGEIYITVSDFDSADLYYMYKSSHASGGYYMVHSSLANSIANRGNPTDSTTGIPGFNAYGGNGSAAYIALYHGDANSTCVFNSINTPYEISYSIKATSATYIAYQVDYTVAKVTAHILEKDISKEYKFDNFYYLNEDIVIDNITYKAGNIIRFVCDAYYGTQYEVDIEYYELILTYYDDKDKTNNSTHKHSIYQFNSAKYIYYYYDEYSNIDAFEDGEIIYNKLSDEVFQKYNESFTYYNKENPSGVTVNFPTTKWIYTSASFDEVKSDLYLDSEGVNSAANATYNESTTYYKQKYVVADVFNEEFNSRKSTLYTNTTGTLVAGNATFDPSATYYELGYTKLSPQILTTNLSETHTSSNTTIQVPIFEYYKHGIYTNSTGTRVDINATYNANTTYYFLQDDGTYSTVRPKYYSTVVSDYVSLTLNQITFEYFKHNIYSDNIGTQVGLDDQYNSDRTYYTNDYVVSTFKNDVLNTYRNVLYKDSNGTALDAEETFNPNITYYSNEFVAATVNNATEFNNMKSRLYANQYGKPLASDETYDSTKTYYKKVFVVATPSPKGNTVEDWIQTKNQITRLYSHTKLTTTNNFVTYESDYTKVYDSNNYPIVYKYTGEGTENIYANPTITVSYEPVRTGTVTQENFDSIKSTLYADQNGTPLANDAVFVQGTIYYIRTWKTVANIEAENVSYSYNGGYYLVRKVDDSLEWYEDQSGVDSNTAGTMDEILVNANSHFHDEHYNEWYGKHYAYNGFTMQSQSEIIDLDGNVVHGYDHGYVYRIVLNANNTEFVWQKVYTYSRKEGAQMVTDASTGVAKVGDTIFAVSQCFGGFYTANKFYRIVDDEFTKTLNVIQFTDVTITNTSSGYTDIKGQKIRYIYQSDYLGYAGTYEIIISAVIRIDNGDGTYTYTDSVRTYKIKFVGTVIM